jgi:hypothetical protein
MELVFRLHTARLKRGGGRFGVPLCTYAFQTLASTPFTTVSDITRHIAIKIGEDGT